jgi:hypothetical protein
MCASCENAPPLCSALFEDGSVAELCGSCALDCVQLLPVFSGTVSLMPYGAAQDLAELAGR